MIRTRTVALALVVLAGGLSPAPASAHPPKLDAEQLAVRALVRATFAGHERAAERVAWCESRFRPWARHRNRNGTTDYGVFQLNDGGTLQSLGLTRAEALDPAANVAAAKRLHARRGWRPWVCSA